MTGPANVAVLVNAGSTTIIEGAVEAVLLAFTVVVGVALERFLKDHSVVAEQKYQGWRHELCYWSALTILITLAIRFLVGSYIHLHVTYVDTPTIKILLRFLKDLFFLFAFGTFLVRAALAERFRSFMYWIMMFSGAGVAWSIIEVITRPNHLAWAWLLINLFQFVVTFACWKYVDSRPDILRGMPAIFAVLVIMFAGLFCVDLWQIIIGSGWTQLPRESLVDVLPERSATPADKKESPDRTWRFAVSGDSRNCGDIVMPAIARSVQGEGAEFYWHLGDLRALYNFDEDMAAEQRKKQLADPKLYPLSIPGYQSRVWDDFIDHQIAPFGRVPFFIGIGNHELVPPKTRNEFVSRFTDWLVTPALQEQRLADDPNDHIVHAYYHWIRDGIDFIYIDNASNTVDDAQMTWLKSVLSRDMSDAAIETVVVGMHEALPENLARAHSMSDDPDGEIKGLKIYHWLLQIREKGKPVYIFASHSHFYMADIFDTAYWRRHGGVLPGWIVGSAGAKRYKLPSSVTPSSNAFQDVYGYLLVTVQHGGKRQTIKMDFVEVKEHEVPAEVTTRYPAGFVSWCFDHNSETHAGPPSP